MIWYIIDNINEYNILHIIVYINNREHINYNNIKIE